MATPEPSRSPFLYPDQLTLAGLATRITDDQRLPPRRRQDIIAALNTFSRVIGKPLTALPAHPSFLRCFFEAATPVAAGITKETWANIRSLILAALKSVGLASVPAATRRPSPQPGRPYGIDCRPARGCAISSAGSFTIAAQTASCRATSPTRS